MCTEISQKYLFFTKKTIHFADFPFNVDKCDYLLFSHCKNRKEINGFICKEQSTLITDLTQDLENIWKNIDRKSTRYSINKAQKEGIIIKINEGYHSFYQIYKEFTRSKGIEPIFKVDINILKKSGTLFVYEHNGEILGGNFYIEGSDNIKLWLSVSKRLNVEENTARLIGDANRLVHWKAIQYAKEKGIKEFDWGGVWSEEEANQDPVKKSINSFKKNFGGTVMTVYNYERINSLFYKIALNLYQLK